jgi:TonB-dependent starch-binding outer membrane protein SusC
MNKKLLISFVILLCLIFKVSAQDGTISGKITSSEDGSALPGVSISVKGTSKGVVTDGNGMFKISAPANSTLRFSYVGFNTQMIAVNNRSVVNVSLVSNVADLDEVVVTGYGASVRKKEATGATSNIKGDVIENIPLQSFDRALQGRTAGVQVNSANGVPGGAVSVRIRGVGSITAGNEPLYVVDGIQINNRNDGGTAVNTNPLSFLNPNDIESIDILKDAATAAIYGAQAANGVVLITTKKGKGGRTKVTLNYFKGIVQPVPQLKVLSSQDFINARIEAVQTVNPTLAPATVRGNVLAALGFNRDLSQEGFNAIPTYDWQKEVYKNGSIDNYEASIQGGNDKTTFYSSLSYNKQDASLINIDFNRFAGRLSIDHKVNSKFKIETGLNVSQVNQRGPYGDANGSTAFSAPQYAAPLLLPFNPIYNADGSYYGMPASGIVMVGDLSGNVVAASDLIKSSGTVNQLVANTALTYNVTKNLYVRAAGGIDYRLLATSFFGDPRLSDYNANRGLLQEANNNNFNYNINTTINFSHAFAKKHEIRILVGGEYREETNTGTNFNANGFPTPELNTANAAAEPSSVGGFWTAVKTAGIFTNINYDFDKKYIFNVVARYDGSSRFGENNLYGFFPSISAKWNIMEESFLKNSVVVSDLGLRASYGTTGNSQIGNFASRRLFGLGGVYQGFSAIQPSQFGNPNLRWERNVTFNLGLDYGFWGGKVKGSIDVFDRASKDLLLTRNVPTTNGVINTTTLTSSVTENVGEIQNRGLEFGITTTNIDRGGFKWESDFNITFLENKVVKLYEGQDILPGTLSIRVGYPLGTNVGVPYAGVNPANGRPMWYDLNGDISYLVRTADNRPLGHSTLSKQFGGFTNTFSYKGLELSAFLQYDLGRVLPNLQEFRLADNAGALRNSLQYYWDNRWTKPGQITDVPRPADLRTEINGRISTYQQINRFYQDASYIRLKTVNLSYNLPNTMAKSIGFQAVKLYIQAVNLYTWTKWTGFDPEFVDIANNTSGGNGTGGNGNQGVVPQSRNFTFGVQIGL